LEILPTNQATAAGSPTSKKTSKGEGESRNMEPEIKKKIGSESIVSHYDIMTMLHLRNGDSVEELRTKDNTTQPKMPKAKIASPCIYYLAAV
jgi:hypothetical protein